jgi:hypothetical protein
MAKLNVPSLQQVIKNLYDTSDMVRYELVRMALNKPRISYRVLHRATQDLVCFKIPVTQIEAGIRRVEKRPGYLKNLLDILRLIDGHFSTLEPDFPPIEVECRYYRIAPDIIIPFQPPLCYGIGGQLHLPYPSYWQRNPLRRERLSVFMSIVDEIREQEPDIENAHMHILDYGIPQSEMKRRLIIVDERDVPRVTRNELTEKLQIFTDGYRAARDELEGITVSGRTSKEVHRPDPAQMDLFGDKDREPWSHGGPKH